MTGEIRLALIVAVAAVAATWLLTRAPPDDAAFPGPGRSPLTGSMGQFVDLRAARS